MALFKNRPLAAAALLLVVAVFLSFLLSHPALIALSVCAAVLLVAMVLFSVFRGLGYRKLFVLLLALGALLGGVRVLFDRQASEHVFAERMERECMAELVVREIRYASTYGTELLVEVRTLEGEGCHETAILRSETALPFGVRDRLLATVQIMPLSYDNYSENTEYTYRGEGAGAILLLQAPESAVLLESGIGSFAEKLQSLRAVLSYRIRSILRGESGELLTAMLLGDRSGLGERTVRDFRRIGISHLLALSGLHLAMLLGIFDRLLYALGAGKRVRICAVLPLCLGYLLLTGCSFSMLRAVIMTLFVYLAFLCRAEHDGLTALAVSAAVILLWQPSAVFSTSFQMTMLATLGLLTFGRLDGALRAKLPVHKGWRGIPFFLLRWVLSSFCVSFAATVMILPVLWLTFGELSLLTPISNLIFVPLSMPLLIGALLLLVFPIPLFSVPMGALVQAALILAGKLSQIDCVLFLKERFAPYIFIPMLLLIALLLVIDLKRRWPMIALPPLLAALAFAVCLGVSDAAGANSVQTVYRRAGSNEGLVLVQNGTAMICDSSNGSLTQLKSDWAIVREMGATELEVLMLTHYHAKEISALARFLDAVMVRAVWLPNPLNDAEQEIYTQLCNIAASRGTSTASYAYDTTITVFGSGELSLSTPLYQSRSTQGAFALSFRYGASSLCYHTAALSEFLRAEGSVHNCAAECLILGAHGPVPHDEITLPAQGELRLVVIGNENVLYWLSLREDVEYIPFPERYDYLLE